MKKLKTIPVLLSSLFLLSLGSLNVSAAVKYVNNTGSATVACGSYRKTFTAKKYFNNFSIALNTALETAGKKATAKTPARVTVEKGHYKLDRTIKVFSNTILDTTGSYFQYYGNLLRNGFDNRQSSGYGYSSAKNITIKGGEWEQLIDYKYANSTDTTKMHSTFRFAHMTNLKVKNAAFKNNYNCHDIEIAGVNKAKIYECRFYNTKSVNGLTNDGGRESLQIDLNDSSAMPYFPAYDLTPCKNIEIFNNRFKNKFRAIGSHHAVLGKPFENISVHNNVMENIGGIAVYAVYWTNSKIYSNVMRDVGLGIDMRNMTSGAGLNFYNKSNLSYSRCESAVRDSTCHIYDNNIRVRVENNIFTRECGIRVMGDHYSADDKTTGTKSGTYKIYNVFIGLDENKKAKPNAISGNLSVGIQLNYGVNSLIKYNTIDLSESAADDSANGIELKGCERVTAASNSIINSKRSDSYGITLTTTAAGFGNNSINLSNNLLDKITNVAININKSDYSELYNNIVTNCGVTALKLNASRLAVAEYNVFSAAKNGAYINGSETSVSLRNNSLTRPENGIYINSADSVYAEENTVKAKTNGVYAANIGSLNLVKNDIYSDSFGVRLAANCMSTGIIENNVKSEKEAIYLNGASSNKNIAKSLLISGNSLDTGGDYAGVRLFYENLDATALTNFRSDGTAVRYRCKGDAMNSYKTVSGELSLDSVTLETSDGVDNLVIKPAAKVSGYRILRGDAFLADISEKNFTAASTGENYTVIPFIVHGNIRFYGIPMTVK